MILTCVAAASMLSACGTISNSLVEKTTHVEFFRIYDLKTQSSFEAIANAASNGVGKDINNMQSDFPINTSGAIPDKPRYMTLTNPFAGSPLGALTEAAGSVRMNIATCDGAVWTAMSSRANNGNFGDNITLCLFPYKGGYQLDMYGALTQQSGGLMQFSRAIVNSALGSPREFMEKAFNDTLVSIHDAVPDAQLSFVRGEPAPSSLPWVASTVLGK